MPFARKTWGNRIRAFLNFNHTPFYPAHDLEAWDREKGFPMPPAPSLSIDDARWREEHAAPSPRPGHPGGTGAVVSSVGTIGSIGVEPAHAVCG